MSEPEQTNDVVTLMLIERELTRLNHDFVYFLDQNKVDELADLFTDDAIYQHGQRVCSGFNEIKALFKRRAAVGTRVSRHIISGLHFEIKTGHSEAAGSSVAVSWADDGVLPIEHADIFLVADFTDDYRRCEDGCWRFSRRNISRVFVGKGNQGPLIR